MAAPAYLAFATVVLVGLAGCTSGTSTETPTIAPTPTFSDSTGAVHGVVVNDEGLPIIGASAGLIDAVATPAVTDASGEFTISNVAPGTYTLSVQALGYESKSQKIDIIIGEVTEVTLTLPTLSIEVPHHLTAIEEGYVLCTFRVYPGVPTTGAGGLPDWITGVAACGEEEVPNFPKDRFVIHWKPLPKDTKEILLEMSWVSNQAAGRGLEIVLEVDGKPNDEEATYGEVVGLSPLRMHVNETMMRKVMENGEQDCMASKCKMQTRVFSSANTTELYAPDLGELGPLGKPTYKADAGVVFDQRNTQYLTTFHGMQRPQDFTALTDQ